MKMNRTMHVYIMFTWEEEEEGGGGEEEEEEENEKGNPQAIELHMLPALSVYLLLVSLFVR